MSARTTTLGLALLLGLAAPAAALDAEDATRLLDNAFLREGDSAKHLAETLRALQQDPTSPLVTLWLTEAARVWGDVEGGQAQAHAALTAALAGAKQHWNQDDLQAALVQLDRAAGRLDQALARQRARGFLAEWVVTGSFGFRPHAALLQAYEPERAAAQREVDLEQGFRGRDGEPTGWRPLTLMGFDVAVSVGDALAHDGSVAYALTHVQLPPAALAAGPQYLVWSGPSARIWINRTLVATIDREQERLDAEVRIPVNLSADAWNRILIKVTGGDNARFSARLTTRDGAPLLPTAYAASQPVDAARGEQAAPLPSFTLAALSEAQPPAAQAVYAQALARTNRGEEAHVLLEDLLAAHPELGEQAWFQQLRGDVARRADHLPASIRRDQARAAYERVLKLAPQHARARRELADFAFEDDHETQGILLLEQILSEHPQDLDTRLALFDRLLAQRWLLEAGEVLDALLAQAPHLPNVLRAKARLLEQRGRYAEAQATREALLATDQSQVWVLVERLDEAVARGDGDAARQALEALGTTRVWDSGELALRRARTLLALADTAGAEVALREAFAEHPWDDQRRLQLAQLLVLGGGAEQRAEARTLLDASLAGDPGAHDVRRLRDALDGQEDRFWEEWAPDVDQLLAEAPGADKWPRAATVCLFDQTVTRIYPDGASSSAVHQLWRILDESGKERYGSRPQAGRLLTVRTITPDGEVLLPISAGGNFQMPGLARGAVVEHAFLSERGPDPLQLSDGPFFFQDPDLSEPFWFSRWVILIHRDAPVEVLERNMDREGITREVEERGEWRVYTFTARDQPRTEPEPGAPDRLEVLPWVKVLQRRSLEELGELYREQGAQGTQLTPTVQRVTARVLEGIEGDATRARALYRFVKEHVRQPGGGGTASQILATRRGSATTLLLTMLRAAGIPCELVVAAPNAAAGRVIDWQRPELDHFTALLLKVEPRDGAPAFLFVDGPRLAPYGRLPEQLWGGTAYVCAPEGGLLEVLPAGDPLSEATLTETTIQLAEGGAATFEVRKTLPGYGVFTAKEQFASAPAHALRQFFAQQAVGVFPSAELIDGGAPEAGQAGTPLVFTIKAKATRVMRERGDGTLELTPGFTPTRLTPQLGSHRSRAFDLLLREGVELRDTVRIELGPYVCPRLPPSVTLAADQALFTLRFRRDSDAIVVERALTMRPGRIRPADYPAFRNYLREVDEAETRTLVLEPR